METITPERMRALEFNSAYLGITPSTLMENAGRGSYEEIKKRYGLDNKNIIVFCGTGNNGGDGLVIARQLSSHTCIDVVLLGTPDKISKYEARLNWEIVERMYERIRTHIAPSADELKEISSLIRHSDVIVDAILGTGVKGALREPVRTAVKMINESKAVKISIDIPSGMDPLTGKILDEAVKPDITLTFHKPKKGLIDNKSQVGQLIVIPISIPVEAETMIGPGDVAIVIKSKPMEIRKGESGKLLVIGGSDRYHGAPIFSAMASIRTGADLVIIAAPDYVSPTIRSYSPNLIVRSYPGRYLNPDSIDYISDLISWSDAVVIGPGLGIENETKKAILDLFRLIRTAYKPLVIDADAIKVLAENPDVLAGTPTVTTPHRGEFKLLTGIDINSSLELKNKVGEIRRRIADFGITFIVKGAVDLVANSEDFKFDLAGNPGMTVGGIGDILTGILGCLLSQKVEPFSASCAAIFLNGLAGNLIAEKVGYHFTASEMIEYIPLAIEKSISFMDEMGIKPPDRKIYELLKNQNAKML